MNEENTGRTLNDDEMAAVSGGAGSGEKTAKCEKCKVNRQFIVYSGNRGKCSVCGNMQTV